MPYRIDVAHAPDNAFEALVELGALDVEPAIREGRCELAAILPDSVTPKTASQALGGAELRVSAAGWRDDGSVWSLHPRAVRAGGMLITFADEPASDRAIRLSDSQAFGTGSHPTTALCLEALHEMLPGESVLGGSLNRLLDVGTGSGILALAGLTMGVPQATGLDIDPAALESARRNAQLNGLDHRLALVLGGPEAVQGTWPLVVANILAAPLTEMAPVLVRRIGCGGRLILSGIQESLEAEVRRVYLRLGLRHLTTERRAGWAAVLLQASW
jgi:ribosomal protein L11 methyltransferase